MSRVPCQDHFVAEVFPKCVLEHLDCHQRQADSDRPCCCHVFWRGLGLHERDELGHKYRDGELKYGEDQLAEDEQTEAARDT